MKKILAMLLMMPVVAQAAFKTGNELWADMNASDYFSKGLAIGYVMAVADTARNVWFCPPATGGGITAGQLHDMVKNFLAASPETRNLSADILVIAVLKQSWPCSGQNRKGA